MATVPLLQRHLLLLLFLSLSPLSLSVDDTGRDALLKLKASLRNTGALDSTWKAGTDPCEFGDEWRGLVCSKDRATITGIHFDSFSLSGVFDVTPLLALRQLRTLVLSNNSFSGPIPEFNRLVYLRSLYISRNAFSGEIPSDFFVGMGALRRLWLSQNNFSGRIPESIGKLPRLGELHLEANQFSGPIPSNISQQSLEKVDFSNNKLQGEIPAGLSKFGKTSFQGNEGLCGKQLNKDCNPEREPSQSTSEQKQESPPGTQASDSSGFAWIVLGAVIALTIVTVLFKARRKHEDFDVLWKENLDDTVHIHIQGGSSNRRSIGAVSGSGSSHRKRINSGVLSRKSSSRGRSQTSDLVVVNETKGIFKLQDLMKAAAEVLGNGGLGSAYKAMMSNGVYVVVKRMKEMNKISRENFDFEIRRFGKLRHPNILPSLAYHFRKEEKLLVSEYVPKGSLLYVLHEDRGICHGKLNWPTRLKIIKGIARGMAFLHTEFASCELPHGNLKSCNILLGEDYEPLLTDYGFDPLINNTSSKSQSLFAYKSPEATALNQPQVSPKSDVYCFGIVILELLTGKFPSQYLTNKKGGTDLVQWVESEICEERESEMIDPEIAGGGRSSLVQMEKLLRVGAACAETDHNKRISMREAIRRIEEIQV